MLNGETKETHEKNIQASLPTEWWDVHMAETGHRANGAHITYISKEEKVYHKHTQSK